MKHNVFKQVIGAEEELRSLFGYPSESKSWTDIYNSWT